MGDNWHGQLGNGASHEERNLPVQVRNLNHVTAIAAGFAHTVALRSDGTVWVWGLVTYAASNIPIYVGNLYDATAIAAGSLHTLIVRRDGTVWTWGNNWDGQLGNGTFTCSRGTIVRVRGPEGAGYFNLGTQLGSIPFTDVRPNDAFYPAVRFVYERGIMNGTSATAFSPHSHFSRAMMATILHRMEETPSVTFRPVFNDVPAGHWYSNAIIWASDRGIVNGVGNNRFAPDDLLTREQIATMLHRYMRESMGAASVNVPAHFNPAAAFTDWNRVSDWAEEGMRWALYHEFISPATPTTINPQGYPTRGECAVIVYRIMTTFAS